MKFLVISSFKDTILSVPPSSVRKAFEATIDGLKQDIKAGKILEMYVIPGQNRCVSIQERESAEELAVHLIKHPISAVVNFEIYPLADMDVWVKSFTEFLKSAEETAASLK